MITAVAHHPRQRGATDMDFVAVIKELGPWAAIAVSLVYGLLVPRYVYMREVQRADELHALVLGLHSTARKAVSLRADLATDA